MKLKGGQIIILLNFLVKITNIAYFWPFKGGIVPPIPPSLAETLIVWGRFDPNSAKSHIPRVADSPLHPSLHQNYTIT
jgi:hypothetical protein